MGLFKKNPFGHILFLKKWLIRVMGLFTHQRYKGFNKLEIEGSDVIRSLPETGVLFVSNHQTYFCLLYTSPSPRDRSLSRMPSSA